MLIQALKSKIHRATVTEANLDYVGSITIDAALMNAVGIREYERVLVSDITNGNRLETYAISGEEGKGTICLNGAAARLCRKGDLVIIMAFALCGENEKIKPKIVVVDEHNKAGKIVG